MVGSGGHDSNELSTFAKQMPRRGLRLAFSTAFVMITTTHLKEPAVSFCCSNYFSTMRFAAAGTLLVLLAGCEAEVVRVPPRTTNTSTAAPAPQAHAPKSQLPAFDPEVITVKTGDEKALEQMIAQHKGKVVFVDYWATWCEPCVEFFPHTVETYDKFHDQGLTAIAVAFDDPMEEKKVRRFLAQHRVGFENLICSYDPGAEAFEKFGIELVPHFRLYDRQGKLRAKWDAAPRDLDAKVKELLAEK